MKSIHQASTVLALACTTAAAAQSFNIDFGPAGVAPSDTYAAAGQAGNWISMPGTQGTSVLDLADIHGVTTWHGSPSSAAPRRCRRAIRRSAAAMHG